MTLFFEREMRITYINKSTNIVIPELLINKIRYPILLNTRMMKNKNDFGSKPVVLGEV